MRQETLTAFVSGKINGLEFKQVIEKFGRLSSILRSKGYKVINPVEEIIHINVMRKSMELPEWTDQTDRKIIMGLSLFNLSKCDEIHFLPDYKESQGSLMELDFAEKMGMLRCFHPFLETEWSNFQDEIMQQMPRNGLENATNTHEGAQKTYVKNVR